MPSSAPKNIGLAFSTHFIRPSVLQYFILGNKNYPSVYTRISWEKIEDNLWHICFSTFDLVLDLSFLEDRTGSPCRLDVARVPSFTNQGRKIITIFGFPFAKHEKCLCTDLLHSLHLITTESKHVNK